MMRNGPPLPAPLGNKASGEGVPQIDKADRRPVTVWRDPSCELAQRPVEHERLKGPTLLAGKETVCQGVGAQPDLAVTLQGPHGRRMERKNPRRTELGAWHVQASRRDIEIVDVEPHQLTTPQAGAGGERDQRRIGERP
jgi:hypothetical protein